MAWVNPAAKSCGIFILQNTFLWRIWHLYILKDHWEEGSEVPWASRELPRLQDKDENVRLLVLPGDGIGPGRSCQAKKPL
jgi:hypothetical protein